MRMRAAVACFVGIVAMLASILSEKAIAQEQVRCSHEDSTMSRPSPESVLCWNYEGSNFYLNVIPVNGPSYHVELFDNSLGGSTMNITQLSRDGIIDRYQMVTSDYGPARTAGSTNVHLGGMPWISIFFNAIENLPREFTPID